MKCEEKVAYKSRPKAESAMHKINKDADKYGWEVKMKSYYKCFKCHKWHLTKQAKEGKNEQTSG